MVEAKIQLDGQEVQTISIPATGKVSDRIKQLKQESMAIFNTYLTQHNLSKEEVNLMEEIISDDEEQAGKKKKKGVKRKVQQTSVSPDANENKELVK